MNFRPEIHGLRAVAVAAVVIYHVWPFILPGGYIGVDVFFVISGFLVTAIIVNSAGIGDFSLSRFYSKRIMRLIPTATVVLLAVLAALPLLPESRWQETLQELASSAFYFQNWHLADQAADYLAVHHEPSPVQHFWSLSLEEQFYVFYPLVLFGVIGVSGKLGLSWKKMAAISIGILCLFSFAASLVITESDSKRAYFVTHVRLWELALGGILVFVDVGRLPARASRILELIGIVAILTAALLYSRQTNFPGYAALLPVIGTALVILAGGCEEKLSVSMLLESRPARFIGDHSYAIYLWHWPLVAFLKARDVEFGLTGGMIVLSGSTLLAYLSKILFEDRLRHLGSTISFRAAAAFAFGCMLIVGAAAATWRRVLTDLDIEYLVLQSGEGYSDKYPGAMVLEMTEALTKVDPVPRLSHVKQDLPETYGNGCHARLAATTPDPRCMAERAGSPKKIILLGDSHAAQWYPALSIIAANRSMNLISLTKSACPFTEKARLYRGKAYTACAEWNTNVRKKVAQLNPELIVISHVSKTPFVNDDGSMVSGEFLPESWKALLQTDAHLLVIADTPALPVSPLECLERQTDCAFPVKAEMGPPSGSVNFVGLEYASRFRFSNLNEHICPKGICIPVIGNVFVWRDHHHLTATYVRTLTPHLKKEIELLMSSQYAPVSH